MMKKKIDIKCPYCERELPNKSFLTKNGCILCDSEYYFDKNECPLKDGE